MPNPNRLLYSYGLMSQAHKIDVPNGDLMLGYEFLSIAFNFFLEGGFGTRHLTTSHAKEATFSNFYFNQQGENGMSPS